MRTIRYQQAISEGYATAMRADESTFIVGEGIGARGGCFVETKGLYKEFGAHRVIDMPISESAFTGLCAGAAICETRAVANLMFIDFTLVAMDQIINQAAKIPYLSGGQFRMPMTITGMYGIGASGGAHHTQPLHPWFIYIPGVKVVMPATPRDVKGLLASAIMDDNLVIVLHHRSLVNIKGPVEEEDFYLPLGEAEVVREGKDVTLVAAGVMRHHGLKAAEKLEQKGISVEVIDPRTLVPLDKETIINSVKKTGRLVVADEGYSPCGFGAEIIAMINDEVFDYLDAPMKRVCTLSAPTPYSPPLQDALVPDVDRIADAITRIND